MLIRFWYSNCLVKMDKDLRYLKILKIGLTISNYLRHEKYFGLLLKPRVQKCFCGFDKFHSIIRFSNGFTESFRFYFEVLSIFRPETLVFSLTFSLLKLYINLSWISVLLFPSLLFRFPVFLLSVGFSFVPSIITFSLSFASLRFLRLLAVTFLLLTWFLSPFLKLLLQYRQFEQLLHPRTLLRYLYFTNKQ